MISRAIRPTAKSPGIISPSTRISTPWTRRLSTPWSCRARAPEYIRLDPRVIEIVKHFGATKKPIAAICHGPQLLVAAGVVAGCECMAYPAVKPDLELAGAKYVDPNDTFSNAHVSGNLVTSPAWPAHSEWIRKFLDMLGTTIVP